MSKLQIHRLPVTPQEPEEQPKKRRKQRSKVTKLYKEVWEEVTEQLNEEVSPRQQRKELFQEFGQFLHEKNICFLRHMPRRNRTTNYQ